MYYIKNINCYFSSIQFESENQKIDLEEAEIKLEPEQSISFAVHQHNPKLFLAKFNFDLEAQVNFFKLNAKIGTEIQFESENSQSTAKEVHQYWLDNQEDILKKVKEEIDLLLINFFKITFFEISE